MIFAQGNGATQTVDHLRLLCQEMQPSDDDFVRCPFLRNINEPTNFSFSQIPTHSPSHGCRGPIFEDGPNFEMAFRIFHGSDGVVPLSGRSLPRHDITPESPPSPPHFNPLAAKAATISLSGFGSWGPFSFHSFANKNQRKKPHSSDEDTSGKGRELGKEEVLGREWLEKGNCPIARSYRAVSRVMPLVAKALQPSFGTHLRCPPVIVAARAALSRTSFARNLRPQPLPAKVLAVGVLGMAVNVPLGVWREHTTKFSPAWFTAVHASVPFVAMIRKSVLMPKTAIAFTLAASVLGQAIGARAERIRLKVKAEKKLPENEEMAGHAPLGHGVVHRGGCRETPGWNPEPTLAGTAVPLDNYN